MELASSHKYMKNASTNGMILTAHLLKTSNPWKDRNDLQATGRMKGQKKAAEWDLYPWRSWKKERFSECGKPPPWPGGEPAQTGSCRGAKPAHPALPGPGKRVQAEAGCWPPESRGQACGQHCCWPHRDDPKGPACALATTSGAREQTTAGCPCTELKPQLDPGAMRLRSRTVVSPHGSGSRQRPSLLAAV